MSNLDELYKVVEKKFRIIKLSEGKAESRLIFSTSGVLKFLLLFIIPGILINLSILQVESVQQIAISLLFASAYDWVFLALISFYFNRLKIQNFFIEMRKILSEDQEALAFVEKGCKKSLKISMYIHNSSYLTVCITCISIPCMFGVNICPMWTPIWADNIYGFLFHAILFFASLIYICVYTTIFIMYPMFLVLIHSYGLYLSDKLSDLTSSGYRDLIKCLHIHQRFVKYIYYNFPLIF